MNKVGDLLNKDVLLHLAEKNPFVCPGLLTVSKDLRIIALECLFRANANILKEFSSLRASFNQPGYNRENANQTFKSIINVLHVHAKHLECDTKVPVEFDRMGWECLHYPSLIEDIQSKTQFYKEQSFEVFASKVISELNLNLPEKMTLREFWDADLKDNDQLKTIKVLDLANSKLKFLPTEINCLTGLTELHLNGNELKDLPLELGSLPNLKFLYLNNNQISELPEEISSLSKLISINLNLNQLNHIPKVLESLPSLVHLRLASNNLRQLSQTFCSMTKLEYLDLSSNPLDKFPSQIGQLVNLTTLSINDAALEDIPNISELKKLKTLSLGKNNLKQFSPELINSLKNLEVLFLKKNPLNEDNIKMLKELIVPYKLEIEFDDI